MAKGPYIVRISSQKGGVGKTTIAVNLATVLSMLDYKVLLVDADYANPSVGFHLGLENVNRGFADIGAKRVDPKSVIVTHAPTGMHVIPGRVGGKVVYPSISQIEWQFKILREENYDFAIVDTAPGILPFVENVYLKNYDEAVIVTTPEMASCTSAIRLAHVYDTLGLKHSLVVNRMRNKRYEISIQEIEESYEGSVTGAVPEDEIVPLSIAEHIPAYLLNQRCGFSEGVSRASKRYAARVGGRYASKREGMSLWDRLLTVLGLRKRNRVLASVEKEEEE
ncbi:MAG: AAA family ATPase [Candidatus Micrarchaeota archaeon]|nr:AAA family ATPase [Candidatus Micrarchaeota archaeon]